jgi:hypothetical protein
MIAPATDLVVSPEVAPENAEAIGFLSELISDSLGKLDSLKRSASTAILDLLEANVRLGWYLEDSRHFLRKEGTYVAWIEQTCPLSYGHTTRLRQLAKHFCRDSIDADQRKKLGIHIPGITEIGEHLRDKSQRHNVGRWRIYFATPACYLRPTGTARTVRTATASTRRVQAD